MITALGDVGRWILRRPHVPAGATPLYARRGTLAVPMVFAVLCGGEIVLLHLLIPWPVVRVIVDLVGVLGLVSVLGMAAAPAVRPHLLFPDRLELRVGGRRAGTVPRELIGVAQPQRRLHPTAPELTELSEQEMPPPAAIGPDADGHGHGTDGRGQGADSHGGGAGPPLALTLPGPDGTNVTLCLIEPVSVSIPPAPGKRARPVRVQEVRLHLDEPEDLWSGVSSSFVPQQQL